MYAVTEGRVHVSEVRELRVDGEAFLQRDTPVTLTIELNEAKAASGTDGVTLKASALTWDVPATKELDLPEGLDCEEIARTISDRRPPIMVSVREMSAPVGLSIIPEAILHCEAALRML